MWDLEVNNPASVSESQAGGSFRCVSPMAQDVSFRRLVDFAKMRGRIERDYQEVKQEVGIGHFEGRGWRGFHHHATLCIAAYGFLISGRETIPRSEAGRATLLSQLAVPENHRSRRSALTARAAYPKLHRNDAHTIGHGAREKPATMPLLQSPALSQRYRGVQRSRVRHPRPPVSLDL